MINFKNASDTPDRKTIDNADISNVFICKFGMRMFHSHRAPELLSTIFIIRIAFAQKQMAGINALRDIARMQNAHSFWYWSVIFAVKITMCWYLLFPFVENKINIPTVMRFVRYYYDTSIFPVLKFQGLARIFPGFTTAIINFHVPKYTLSRGECQ